MKQNHYDDETFFLKYSQFPRSVEGLSAAGEWHALEKMLPSFSGKRILDLGCGFGWHCIYAYDQGAKEVLGIDLSEKMLSVAREKAEGRTIRYERYAIEDFSYVENAYDIVISSLALHYVEDYEEVCRKIYHALAPGGSFVFSAEHPIFTAEGRQDWVYGDDGRPLYWPVDRYFYEGERSAVFLGEKITKVHRTVATYISILLQVGFQITGVCEPTPTDEMVRDIPGIVDELRRPMMLIVKAVKP